MKSLQWYDLPYTEVTIQHTHSPDDKFLTNILIIKSPGCATTLLNCADGPRNRDWSLP